MKTAKLFANLDVSMKSTHQSLEKLTIGITQLRERNNQMLEILHIIPQINDGLNVEELIKCSSTQ
ncbi:21737_t:CDS:2 [Rhizophagus irregularis]|nr:21737_t:CDS:2 [Rhizophagus irregularis]